MPRIENVLNIAREPGEVIAYLADGRNEPDWNPDASNIVLSTDGPVRAGSRFHGHFKGLGDVAWEITELDPAGILAATITSPRVTIRARFRAAPRDPGTRLTEAIELHPHGLFRILLPIMLPAMKARFKNNRARMKQNLERAQPNP
jgi:hypothetical protein